jgi:hypothetical protein
VTKGQGNALRRAGGTACGLAAAVAMLALATATPAAAGPGGKGSSGSGAGNNKGDVWVDAAGQGQVGQENDPHLGCNDIAVWGAALNDASGPFAIQGWAPSGGKETDYSATWHYDTGAGGSQVIAVVPVHTLIANAMAAGDAPVNKQGFHFKLDLEDPRTGASVGDDKYKVFWVDCGVTRTGTTPTPTPSPTPATSTPTPTPSGGVGGATPTPTPGGGVGGLTPTPTPTPASGVEGITTGPGATPGSGVAAAIGGSGASIPFTGTVLPLGLAGGLAAGGLGLLGLSRRRRNKT